MSNPVDRPGTFRFDHVLESGVSKTKNGFPSFNVRLHLEAFYDEEEGQWVDWAPYETEISAYFTLFGKAKKSGQVEPTLNHQQVMAVFGWDGRSFAALGVTDFSDIKGQVRIGANTYEGAKSPFQVDFIDVYNADPVRQLRKLDPDALKTLDSEFAHLLQSSGKAPKAATVPAQKPTTQPVLPKKPVGRPKKIEVPAPAGRQLSEEEAEPFYGTVNETEEERKVKIAEKSKRIREAQKPVVPQPPARQPVTPPTAPQSSPSSPGPKCYTKQQAYEIVVEMKADDTTDEQLQAAWFGGIDAVAPETEEKNITGEQWGEVVDYVLDTDRGDGKMIAKF